MKLSRSPFSAQGQLQSAHRHLASTLPWRLLWSRCTDNFSGRFNQLLAVCVCVCVLVLACWWLVFCLDWPLCFLCLGDPLSSNHQETVEGKEKVYYKSGNYMMYWYSTRSWVVKKRRESWEPKVLLYWGQGSGPRVLKVLFISEFRT